MKLEHPFGAFGLADRRATSPRRRRLIAMCVTAGIVLCGAGLIVADTITRLQHVTLHTHIQIWKQIDGDWQMIDEVGPRSVHFSASLLDLAAGRRIETPFTLVTRSRSGLRYTAGLAGPASVSLNPLSGRTQIDLVFDVTYGDRRAKVPGRLTTESLRGPAWHLHGHRGRGILGRSPFHVTFVSANRFQPPDEAEALMLVCTEAYTFVPARPAS